MNPDELLRELGALATSMGPAILPTGADELLRSVAETARQLFGAAACSIAVLSEDESELIYTTAAGEGAATVSGMRIPSSHGIAGWVAQSGQPISVADLAGDPRFSPALAEQTGYVPQTMLVVPVQTPQRMLGVLSLLDRDASRPGAERDMAMLSLFADQAALALAAFDRVRALGQILLGTLAEAADGTDLADALRHAASQVPDADTDLASLAATFSSLARRGAAERQLALAVLRDIEEYAERRPPRRH